MVPSAHSGGMGTRPVVGRSCNSTLLRFATDKLRSKGSGPSHVNVSSVAGNFVHLWTKGEGRCLSLFRQILGFQTPHLATWYKSTTNSNLNSPPCPPPRHAASSRCCQRHRGPRLLTSHLKVKKENVKDYEKRRMFEIVTKEERMLKSSQTHHLLHLHW